MSLALTPDEASADIAFLLLRAGSAGRCSFTSDRWTGMSSNSLVALAYGGEQKDMPLDRSDYAACVRTYMRLPRHRKTAEVRAGLAAAREAYLGRYPAHRQASSRREEHERHCAQQAEWQQKQNRKRQRRTW